MPRKGKVTTGKVTMTDYYREYEGVQNMDLKEGTRIVVHWPDGTSSKEILHVVDGRGSAQVDMNGIPDRFPTRRLYVKRCINGQDADVSLKGLRIDLEQEGPNAA